MKKLSGGQINLLCCCCADQAPARNDFVCQVGCISGKDAVLALGGNQSLANSLNASYFVPPYAVNNGDNRYNISYKTVAITAMHYDGTLEYNAHNLYGMYETLATADALQKLRNKRQFILTRCGISLTACTLSLDAPVQPPHTVSCEAASLAALCGCSSGQGTLMELQGSA